MSDLREAVVNAYGRAHQESWDRGEGAEAAAHLAGIDAAIRAVIEALAAEAEYLEPDARLSPRDVQRLLRGHLGDTEATDE